MGFESFSGAPNEPEPTSSVESLDSVGENRDKQIKFAGSYGLKERLRAKLEEYRERQNEAETDQEVISSAAYKEAVLAAVLDSGTADYEEVKGQLGVRSDQEQALFDEAWAVVKSYTEPGGVETVGGTGLPPEQITARTEMTDLESFDQLYAYLEKVYFIQGSDGTRYEYKDLKDIIDRVRSGELEPEHVTRTGGLRETVVRLLQAEQS